MSNKKLFIIILLIVILIGGGYGVWALTRPDERPSTAAPITSNPAVDNMASDSDTATQTYSREEVAQHSSRDDCWTIINDEVYDLTSFIARHPGGDEILRACGIDGSSLFNQRHTTEGEAVGSGTPHDGQAQSELASLKIGTLKD